MHFGVLLSGGDPGVCSVAVQAIRTTFTCQCVETAAFNGGLSLQKPPPRPPQRASRTPHTAQSTPGRACTALSVCHTPHVFRTICYTVRPSAGLCGQRAGRSGRGRTRSQSHLPSLASSVRSASVSRVGIRSEVHNHNPRPSQSYTYRYTRIVYQGRTELLIYRGLPR